MIEYNGKRCVTYAELSGVLDPRSVRYGVERGFIEQARRACKGSPALFVVDTLPAAARAEVYRRCPDPGGAAASAPFVEAVEADGAALHFYDGYTLADGRHLSREKVMEYANGAAVLNAFRALLERGDGERLKQGRGRVNRSAFWAAAARALPRVADGWPNGLPGNARRLQERYNEYRREGYVALIPGRYGTRNAAKVDDGEKEALLVTLIGMGNNLDNAQVARLYNEVGARAGWKAITARAVGTWREKRDLETSASRLGASRFRAQRAMQVKRSRPTLPLLYWTVDGWTAELLYRRVVERGGRQVTTYSERLTVVIVLDPCVDYPVGYAIGERECPALIKAAFRDAVNHTAALFGQRYRVNQLQTDNYGRGSLRPFYEVTCETYTPARAHNAKAKVIEPFFNHFNRKYCQLYKNWSGFGITSNKNRQPNGEFLNRYRGSFPTEVELRERLASLVEAERAEKRERYVALFAGLPGERRLPLSDEQYLLTFGEETGRRHALEGPGLRVTIGGERHDYDCFDPRFREYAHVRWAVKHDPGDLSRVLAVNEDESLRFLLERKHVQPMALAERSAGDAAALERVFAYNRQLEGIVGERISGYHRVAERFLEDHPGLDVATRLLVCDSRGQHKDHKPTRRAGAREIEDIEAIKVTAARGVAPAVDDEAIFDLY